MGIAMRACEGLASMPVATAKPRQNRIVPAEMIIFFITFSFYLFHSLFLFYGISEFGSESPFLLDSVETSLRFLPVRALQ
jgi:hypothetical protein